MRPRRCRPSSTAAAASDRRCRANPDRRPCAAGLSISIEQGLPAVSTVGPSHLPGRPDPPAPKRLGLGSASSSTAPTISTSLPAIVVMLDRHRLPDLLHDRTELLQHAGQPAAERQAVQRPRQLRHHPDAARSFWKVTWQTVIWTVLSTLFAFLLGLGAALALHREFVGRGVLRAPAADPVGGERRRRLLRVEVALSLRFRRHRRAAGAAGRHRPADQLHRQHQHLALLADRRQRLEGILLRHDHADGRPADRARQLLRAAQVDGASAWQRFWHVTFPHLQGVSMVTMLLLVVPNFNSFIIPWIMTGGGPVGLVAHLDHPHLRARLRAAALGRRARPTRCSCSSS